MCTKKFYYILIGILTLVSCKKMQISRIQQRLK